MNGSKVHRNQLNKQEVVKRAFITHSKYFGYLKKEEAKFSQFIQSVERGPCGGGEILSGNRVRVVGQKKRIFYDFPTRMERKKKKQQITNIFIFH